MTKPKRKIPIEVQSLARSHTEMAVKVLAGIALSGDKESARVAAAEALLDRGWGKARQNATLSGELEVTIRKIATNAK